MAEIHVIPKGASEGVVLPIGTYKGSRAIYARMDILSGVITGAGFAGGVNDQYNNWVNTQNVGHFFMALKPGIFFLTKREFFARMGFASQACQSYSAS